ncbi:MAG: MATE family efflux transporter [Clostridia bacterium]|nr:MATE family efflux transporter [Clostridia bacterium]
MVSGVRNSKSVVDMTKGSIVKNLITFALPFALSGILQMLFNAADMIIVGQFSKDSSTAVGAIGATSSLIHVFVNFFMGFSVGATVLIARYFGSKQENDLNQTIHTAILLSVISGLVLTVIGVFATPFLLSLMDTQPEHLPLSTVYLRIYFGGIISTMVYNFGSAILRAVGDTKRPLLFLFIAGIINVLLNVLFVSIFKMSVDGVAIATVISQTVAAVIILIYLSKLEGSLKLSIKNLKITKSKLIDIIKIGVPAGIQSMMFSLSNTIIQTSVNGFGELVVNGNSAGSSIDSFTYTSMNAINHASLSFVAQNIGAGESERAKKSVIIAPVLAMLIGLVLGMSTYFLGKPLLKLYISEVDATLEATTIEFGMQRLKGIAFNYYICGMLEALTGILRGAGFSLAPMLINVIGICGVRILWVFTIFSIPSFHTYQTLLLSYPISWIIVSISLIIVYFTVGRKKILEDCKKNKILLNSN